MRLFNAIEDFELADWPDLNIGLSIFLFGPCGWIDIFSPCDVESRFTT